MAILYARYQQLRFEQPGYVVIINRVVVHRQHASYLAAQGDLEHPSRYRVILLPDANYVVEGVPLLPEDVERADRWEILTVVGVYLEANVSLPHCAFQ